jgi:hypothetical protein
MLHVVCFYYTPEQKCAIPDNIAQFNVWEWYMHAYALHVAKGLSMQESRFVCFQSYAWDMACVCACLLGEWVTYKCLYKWVNVSIHMLMRIWYTCLIFCMGVTLCWWMNAFQAVTYMHVLFFFWRASCVTRTIIHTYILPHTYTNTIYVHHHAHVHTTAFTYTCMMYICIVHHVHIRIYNMYCWI